MPEQNERELSIYVIEQTSIEELRAVLSDERLTWAYALRMEDTALGWLRDLLNEKPLGAPLDGVRPGLPLKCWTEGRAFGPQLEVDWQRDGETYHLRALLEEGEPPQNVDWGVPDGATLRAHGGEHYVLLHGALDESSEAGRPTWSEARIPRRLAYPYDPQAEMALPQRVALAVQDYARDGVVVLTRLLQVATPQD